MLTSRFNQDAIENWFSSVRAKGFNNDSRTTTDYESSVKNIAVNWLLEQPEKGANCQDDGDSFLSVLDYIRCIKKTDTRACPVDTYGSPSDEMDCTVAAVVSEPTDAEEVRRSMAAMVSDASGADSLISDWPDVFELTEVDSNVVAYICGYMCMKIERKNDCTHCSQLYQEYRDSHSYHSNPEFAAYEVLGKFRNFDWAKHGLQRPPFSEYRLCSAIEKLLQMNMETAVNGQIGIMSRLTQLIGNTVSIDNYHMETACSSHQEHHARQVIRLYLRIRIHHFVRIRNRELKQLELQHKNKLMKTNRKLDKISHN